MITITTKEDMTAYLEKFQTWQREAQGIADVDVKINSRDHVLKSVEVWIYPRNEQGDLTEGQFHFCEVNEWNYKNDNDLAVKAARNYMVEHNIVEP